MKTGDTKGGVKKSLQDMATTKDRIEKFLNAPDDITLDEIKFFVPKQPVRDNRRQKRA